MKNLVKYCLLILVSFLPVTVQASDCESGYHFFRSSDDNCDESEGRSKFLGLSVDLLPLERSVHAKNIASNRQLWIGLGHMRVRLLGANMGSSGLPNASEGFQKLNTSALALNVDYLFTAPYRGWWVGTGLERWKNSATHKDHGDERVNWKNAVVTVSGGYIRPFLDFFYVEPWVAAHVVVDDTKVKFGEDRYQPQRFVGEVALRLGWFMKM